MYHCIIKKDLRSITELRNIKTKKYAWWRIDTLFKKDKFVHYSNSVMKSGNWIGHSGLGGQFLAANLKTGIVASFFSVIDTPSGTDDNYKKDMICMMDEVVNSDL